MIVDEAPEKDNRSDSEVFLSMKRPKKTIRVVAKFFCLIKNANKASYNFYSYDEDENFFCKIPSSSGHEVVKLF